MTTKDKVAKNPEGGIDLFSLDEDQQDRDFIKAEQYYIKAQEALGNKDKADAAANFKQAVIIWQRLFENGSGEAAYRLGKLYQTGEGVPKDKTQSYLYFKKGQYYGSPKARHALDAMKAHLSDRELAALERESIERF